MTPAAADPACVVNSQALDTCQPKGPSAIASQALCAHPWYTPGTNMEYLCLVYPVLSALFTLIFLQKLRHRPHVEDYQA